MGEIVAAVGTCLGISLATPRVPAWWVTAVVGLPPGTDACATAGASPVAIVARLAATATPSPLIRVRFTRSPPAKAVPRPCPVRHCAGAVEPVHPDFLVPRLR